MILSLLATAVPVVNAQQAIMPKDLPYPGIIELQVDATNVGQKIFKVHERIPVKAGRMTLLYPKWRLGAHSPAGFLFHSLQAWCLPATSKGWNGSAIRWICMHSTWTCLPA